MPRHRVCHPKVPSSKRAVEAGFQRLGVFCLFDLLSAPQSGHGSEFTAEIITGLKGFLASGHTGL